MIRTRTKLMVGREPDHRIRAYARRREEPTHWVVMEVVLNGLEEIAVCASPSAALRVLRAIPGVETIDHVRGNVDDGREEATA